MSHERRNPAGQRPRRQSEQQRARDVRVHLRRDPHVEQLLYRRDRGPQTQHQRDREAVGGQQPQHQASVVEPEPLAWRQLRHRCDDRHQRGHEQRGHAQHARAPQFRGRLVVEQHARVESGGEQRSAHEHPPARRREAGRGGEHARREDQRKRQQRGHGHADPLFDRVRLDGP